MLHSRTPPRVNSVVTRRVHSQEMREGVPHDSGLFDAVAKPNPFAELGELRPVKTLGEEVSDVVIGSDIRDAQCLSLNPLTNTEIARVDVLAALTRRFGTTNCLSGTQIVVEYPQRVSLIGLIRHVLTIEFKPALKRFVSPNDWLETEYKPNVREKLAAPNGLGSSSSTGNQFGLVRAGGSDGLQLRSPRNGTTEHEEDKSSVRLAFLIEQIGVVRVGEAGQTLHVLTVGTGDETQCSVGLGYLLQQCEHWWTVAGIHKTDHPRFEDIVEQLAQHRDMSGLWIVHAFRRLRERVR